MQKKTIISASTTLEELVRTLVEMQFTCLSPSDFRRSQGVHRTMENRTDRCFYSRPKKCLDCDLDSVSVWMPLGKYFLELEFNPSGEMVISGARLCVGKNQYGMERALQLANKLMF